MQYATRQFVVFKMCQIVAPSVACAQLYPEAWNEWFRYTVQTVMDYLYLSCLWRANLSHLTHHCPGVTLLDDIQHKWYLGCQHASSSFPPWLPGGGWGGILGPPQKMPSLSELYVRVSFLLFDNGTSRECIHSHQVHCLPCCYMYSLNIF